MSGRTGLAFDEALAVVADVAARSRLPGERLALARTHGRILAEDVVAPFALQPFDNSAMDGFAVRHADIAADPHGTWLRIAGTQFAGPALGLALEPGTCVRITTGAPLPAGADTVAIRERVDVEDARARIPAGIAAGANVRRAGEDVQPGEQVLSAGGLLTPARVSVAASLGIDQLTVARRPTVAVFTTGDELVAPGLPLQPGQIYDSNRELLMGLLRADGLEPTAWPALPDDPARIASVLADAASSFDVVVTCGGVSAGERDHLPDLLRRAGTIHFWKVRMKPGMPVLFGRLGQAQLLCLPGNPVSVLATWLTLGRALVDGLQGRSEPRPRFRARLSAPIDKPHPRREFVRGRLASGDDGTLLVTPDAATGSHRLAAAARADALVVVPEDPQRLAPGAVVEVLPF